jgi:DNA-directed RNA polymerase specialized sigma24 family protein
MENWELEVWYKNNRRKVIRHFAGKYGTETVSAEDALQDVMVRLLALERPLRTKTVDEVEKIIWVAVDNALKQQYNTYKRRCEGEQAYAKRDLE